ncbi:hypothetical protein J6590_027301 [Homalodisca vitripennis]|nr:hypothetical protein J6590_027301 [Homalodisca vitripennis]
MSEHTGSDELCEEMHLMSPVSKRPASCPAESEVDKKKKAEPAETGTETWSKEETPLPSNLKIKLAKGRWRSVQTLFQSDRWRVHT